MPVARIVEEKKAGSSYQTSGDPRLHIGLGDADIAMRVFNEIRRIDREILTKTRVNRGPVSRRCS